MALPKTSTPGPRPADSDTILRLRRELRTERAELDRLLDRYGSAHVEVVAARARIADVEDAIEAEVAREARRLRTELSALEREETMVIDALSSARDSLVAMRQAEARLGQLQGVVDAEQDALDRLEEQRRALRSEAELPAAEIEVLSPASVPLFADGRGRSYYLAATLFAAAMVALTAAFFREMLDKSVRSHEQLQAIPGISPAGLVPAIPRRRLPRPWRRDGERVSQIQRDAIEGLVLALEQREATPLPSILVTSAFPGEGKTTIAAALAAELGRVRPPRPSRRRGSAQRQDPREVRDRGDAGLRRLPGGRCQPVGRRASVRHRPACPSWLEVRAAREGTSIDSSPRLWSARPPRAARS